MIIKLKVKDLNIIEQAATLIRNKFKIGLIIAQCSREINTTDPLIKACSPAYFAYLGVDPQLKIEATTTKDHDGWTEHIYLEYSISGEDLKDGSLVDELISGDLSKQAPDMRQVLRLAFILYDGIRYATIGEHKKAYTDKGWRSRVLNIQRHSYVIK